MTANEEIPAAQPNIIPELTADARALCAGDASHPDATPAQIANERGIHVGKDGQIALRKPPRSFNGVPTEMTDAAWNEMVTDGATFTGMKGGTEKHALAMALMERGYVDPLIDKTGKWLKGTFLFDSNGKVTPKWADAFAAASKTIVESPEHANVSAIKLKPLIVAELQKDPAFDKAYLHQMNTRSEIKMS